MFLFILPPHMITITVSYLNTSHVLIYQTLRLFSSYISSNLNTSHVLIYRQNFCMLQACVSHLNTSHVLIYPKKQGKKKKNYRFKYISCSYLSEHLICLLQSIIYLNTSHVLIYQWEQREPGTSILI